MKESKRKKLTQARLKDLMHYNPETGVLYWKKNRAGVGTGPAGGGLNSNGYLRVCVDQTLYFYHRLVWLYVHGYFPENDIDHIDRNKTNNSLVNLREVSHRCNLRNSKVARNNTSGVKGVHWSAKEKRWVASIAIDRRNPKRLGAYKHKHNAVCARLAGEQCLDWAGCDSNSSAYQYVKNMVGM